MHGAAHVGAEIVEGDDIVVGADAVPSVPSELDDEVVVRLKGVGEVDGLSLFKRRERSNMLAGIGAGYAGCTGPRGLDDFSALGKGVDPEDGRGKGGGRTF